MNPSPTVEEETSSSLFDAITSSSLSSSDSLFNAAVTRSSGRSKTDGVMMYILPDTYTRLYTCIDIYICVCVYMYMCADSRFYRGKSIHENQMVLSLTSACLQYRCLYFRLSYILAIFPLLHGFI